MAINVYQVNDLMANMFSTTSVPGAAGAFPSEFPLVSDNFNNNLSRYGYIMGVWGGYNLGADHTAGNSSWSQDVGNGSNGRPHRPTGGYYARSVFYTNEANYWGYIASLVGGYLTMVYGFDSVGATVDYDGKLLGHGTTNTYPFAVSSINQFRDSNNLPADGTSQITSTGSSYTRSRYVPPSYFTLMVTAGGTVGSGNVRFLVEQRPSHIAMQNSRTQPMDYYGDIFTATNSRNLNLRRLSIVYARILAGNNVTVYAYPLEEDGTNVGITGGAYGAAAISPTTGIVPSRTPDQRIRHHAMFPINEEYFGFVHETHVVILSNKSLPNGLLFFDLKDTLTTPARIAGVTVNQAKNKIYFLCEDGQMAVYDFTVSGGQISALTTAPALAAGEKYGAISLSSDGTKIYVLNGCWSADPTQTTAGTGRIGVSAYTIGTNSWGASNDSALQGRHNSRSLTEMITLSDGKLAMLVEKGSVGGGNFTNTDAVNIAWQLMVFDPSLATWNTNQIDATGAFLFGTGATKWAASKNASLVNVASGKLLINTNWLNNAIWVCDVSGAAASVDNTKLTAIGKGQANDIFPAGVTTGAKVQIRKSQSDTRTIFWHSESNQFNAPVFYLAPPSFAWTSGTLSTLSDNANSGTVTTSFDKDKLSHGDGRWNTASVEEYSLLTYFNESYVGLFVTSTPYYNAGSGEYGIAYTSLYSNHHSLAMVYIPTYYKQVAGNPVLADSWADASANAFAVPTTPGTDINIPYGLKVQFGPASGTTYAAGDYHSFNVTYGSIKYQRKSRFAWAMFAGQTFQDTVTKTLTAVKAIKPCIIDGNWTTTPSGPASITGIANSRTSAQWPKLNGGVAQNTPAVLELVCSNSPDPTTLINIPGDGKVVTTDNQGSNPATNAFNGNPNSFWRTNASGSHYLQIDLGTSQTVNAYSLRFNTGSLNEAPSAWIVKGSATGAFAGEEVTVDSQSIPGTVYSNHAFNVGTPGSYRYYRIVFASNGGNWIQAGSVRLYSAVLTNSVNFSEIVFGNGWERGLTFEVDTGSGYGTITPLWRAHNGGIWCFTRQVGVQKIRITVQAGANQYSGNTVTGNAQMGPYTFIDYGTQVQMDAARLGNAGALDGDPTRGSFDTQCLGIACDAVTISIDGDSPISRTPYGSANPVFNFYDWVTIPANQYKVHPFWGFVLFPGAGGSQAASTQTGTNMTITYNWGRRV